MSLRIQFIGRLLGIILIATVVTSCRSRKASDTGSAQTPAQPVAQEPLPVSPAAPLTEAQMLARGQTLFTKHCAVCHGPQGLGDGAAAYLLYPKPRNFSEGQFRIGSTTKGLPTDADMIQTLRRGMPGSAMPSWAHLSETDLKSVVLAVRQLALDGKIAQLMAKNKSTTREKATSIAHDLLDPGPLVEIPAEPAAVEISLAKGKEIYLASCAACHGADGRAKEKGDLKDIAGYPAYARDFTQGIFKGSPDGIELARRIAGGLRGSPMPGQPMPANDLWSLVHYVQGMVKPGAEERVLQSQKLLIAKRTAEVPHDPGSPSWDSAPATFLPVMPLWWRDDRIEGVAVRALHDGKTLAIELSWADATPNDLATKPEWFGDGAALQFSSEADPPFFGMGGKEGQVSIWHWKATWQHDMDGKSDSLAETYKNRAQDDFGALSKESRGTGTDAGNPVSQREHASPVETLAARGQGTLTSQVHAMTIVRGIGRWKEGRWHVVFARPLAASEAGEMAFVPGKEVSVALAVWDGQAGDRNGQKSVTIWHRLLLASP
jgi:mono/diheme cytochrome c family protein